MQYFMLFVAVYVVLVFDAALVDILAVGRVAPDFLAVVALAWLIVLPASVRAVWIAAAIGLASDVAAGGRVGAGVAAYALVGFAIIKLRTKVDADHPLVQTLLTWPTASLIAVCVGAAQLASGELETAAWPALLRGFLVGVYTAAASLPLWMVLSWIREPLQRRRRRLADAW